MSRLTRNWLIGSVIAWTLLVYGWSTDDTWVIGTATVIFLILTVERYDNWRRHRPGGDR